MVRCSDLQHVGLLVAFVLSSPLALREDDAGHAECSDKTFQCAYWSMLGDCETSQPYMSTRCASSCRFCNGDSSGRARGLYADLEQRHAPDADAVERSFDPRVYTFDDFLSEDECELLKAYAGPRLEPARVIDQASGESGRDTVRTSMQMYVNDSACREHPVISALIRRMHVLARLPLDHAEPLQVGRYGTGEFYEPHFDSSVGLSRAATVLIYLGGPEEGGQTIFPKRRTCAGREFGSCCVPGAFLDDGGLALGPQKGRAVLFYSYDLDGRHNALSLHGSCPVISGEKWIAQQWFRTKVFAESPHYVKPKALSKKWREALRASESD